MERRQILLIGGIFAGVVAVLAIVWFVFLRPGYGMLYEDLREADAAEIVGVLEKQGIEYRLEDGGHRLLVPEADIGRARVLVAGSGVATGGTVGFELFNESDMGLTEFAQKVNYQRALQGELARTIMGMDGIAFARVHLSLPERTLFRANQAGPKGAVTLQTAGNATLEPARVTGIQQLVSSAVPDLPAREVAVLDHRGRLLSPLPVDDAGMHGELDERAALEEYYRARIRGVAEKLIPGMPFDIRVLAVPSSSDETPNARNFSLRIALRTEMELGTEDRDMLQSAIGETAGLEPGNGDVLRFETGPLEDLATPGPAELVVAPPEQPALSPIVAPEHMIAGDWLGGSWLWALLAVPIVLLLIALRRRSRLSPEEQQSFAELLGEKIAMAEGAPNGE
ncbi:flagellar M-ring protein FliF [Altererythrobacter sp. CC-YST694]|uniref:flagellar basal-body MS-ring/collar protein FliF n=1 Tax=Altererythrobacter sp. CC-YST694 TaxID=2755038 RepID=UPI001D028579|nr:flagellar basal-body MS-ring/collar protein FliF [Altererythrobacter sp. CC-YST694]MCB5423835.1 flagellar M-ring protein FliF [Altererythrobacter sp. CC-YST694]